MFALRIDMQQVWLLLELAYTNSCCSQNWHAAILAALRFAMQKFWLLSELAISNSCCTQNWHAAILAAQSHAASLAVFRIGMKQFLLRL